MNLPQSALSYRVQQRLRGMGYGARQPSVIAAVKGSGAAELVVDLAANIAIDAVISTTLAQLLSAAAPTITTGTLAQLAGARLLYWSLALQRAAGLPVFDPGRVLRAVTEPTFEVTLLLPHPPGQSKAAAMALDAVTGWWGRATAYAQGDALAQSVRDKLAALRAFAPPGKNTMHFLRAAHEAGLPWDRVTANCYQYGWGANSCLMESSYTEHTSALGATLARNKVSGAEVLRRAGLPAPEHALARNVEEALLIAERLGYPVVVKPADLDGGVGVAAGLRDAQALRRAFDVASGLSRQVLVEKHFHGRDYRMLVFRGRLVSTVLRQPGGVTGNGRDSVAQLLAELHRDPARGNTPDAARKPITLDEEASDLLAEQGLSVEAVPRADQFVPLRRAANVAMGGRTIPAFDQVHPENRLLAEQAAKAFGLDLAGIDLLIPDIATSWRDSGAAICEVNGQPQFGVSTQKHLHGQILRGLVPYGGRVATLVLVGHDNAALIAALQEATLPDALRIGVASDKGAFLQGVQLGKITHLHEAARALLFNKELDLLIVDISDAAVLSSGLPMDRFDLLVLASCPIADSVRVSNQIMNMLAPHSAHGVLVNDADAACQAWSRDAQLAGHASRGISAAQRDASTAPIATSWTAMAVEARRVLTAAERGRATAQATPSR